MNVGFLQQIFLHTTYNLKNIIFQHSNTMLESSLCGTEYVLKSHVVMKDIRSALSGNLYFLHAQRI